MEWYRDDLEEAKARDPYNKLRDTLLNEGFDEKELIEVENTIKQKVKAEYQQALKADDPRPEDLYTHVFAPTLITEEKGNRSPEGKDKTVMVDSALFAIRDRKSVV